MAGPSMLELDIFSVFMCKECKTILAEGRHACECNEVLNVIAFISATMEVEVEEIKRYNLTPNLEGCVYSNLKCRVCTANVGMLLTCAVAEVAHLRKLFCLFRNSILCYSMETKKILEGEMFHFNASTCVTQLQELEQELFETHKRVQELSNLMQNHRQSPPAED